MSALLAVLVAIGIVIAVFSLVDLLRARRGYERSALFAWVLIIVILPLVGSIFYWVSRAHRDKPDRVAAGDA